MDSPCSVRRLSCLRGSHRNLLMEKRSKVSLTPSVVLNIYLGFYLNISCSYLKVKFSNKKLPWKWVLMVSTAAGDKSWRKVWQSWHKFHLIEKVWRRTFQVYDESGYFCWQEQDYQNMEKCSLDKSFILLLIVKGTTYLRCKCLLFKTDASLVGKLILASCCQVIINFNISNNTNNWGNCVDKTALYNKVKIKF